MTGAKIAKYMTVGPHTVGAEQTLEQAHRLMRAHRIRHLPVLRARELVGIVSLRDLYFLETIAGVDPDKVTVEDAMTAEPFVVDADASLARVAREMCENKYGCAVVMEHGDVIGVFTTTDALRVLADVLTQKRPRHHAASTGPRRQA